jgi:hypothetical protein
MSIIIVAIPVYLCLVKLRIRWRRATNKKRRQVFETKSSENEYLLDMAPESNGRKSICR